MVYKPFQLAFHIPPANSIDPETSVFSMGSCFATHMHHKLTERGFNALFSHQGIVFNPLSLAGGLQRLTDNTPYEQAELEKHQEIWFSFDHHSDYSDRDKAASLQKINSEFQRAAEQLKNAGILLCTFGTAYYYQLNSTGKIVSNCHKIPQSEFTRKLASHSEITQAWTTVISRVLEINPRIKFIFSVSPVRHIRDGLTENNISKAHLLIASHSLLELFPENVSYFPAYEIVVDELRDYRFYEADMVHPSPVAVDYVWQRFTDTWFSSAAEDFCALTEPIAQMMKHRTRFSGSPEDLRFRENLNRKMNELKQHYPHLNQSSWVKTVLQRISGNESQ